jgi:hypothetical protein
LNCDGAVASAGRALGYFGLVPEPAAVRITFTVDLHDSPLTVVPVVPVVPPFISLRRS